MLPLFGCHTRRWRRLGLLHGDVQDRVQDAVLELRHGYQRRDVGNRHGRIIRHHDGVGVIGVGHVQIKRYRCRLEPLGVHVIIESLGSIIQRRHGIKRASDDETHFSGSIRDFILVLTMSVRLARVTAT